MESRRVGSAIYYKGDSLPFGALFFGATSKDKAPSWIKIDLGRPADNKDGIMPLLGQAQVQEIEQAFKRAKLVKPIKLIDSQTLEGEQTWRYEASIDKQELRSWLENVMKVVGRSSDQQYISGLTNKLEVRKVEVWIGKLDRTVRQVSIESNAPSLIDYSLGYSLRSAKNRSRDARRTADIRRIMSALELFYNDNGRYPRPRAPKCTAGGFCF